MHVITANADWIANDKGFRETYDPTNPIKVVWRNIYNATVYANAGSTPYSIKQVIDNTYQLLFNTGVFAADCW